MNRFIIGDNIKRHRNFKGIKQEAFANKIRVSRVMLSRYENGRSVVSPEKLTLIAQVLDVSIESLLKVSLESGGVSSISY
jgi:transcriptional regulator with XRE-family HTH domain